MINKIQIVPSPTSHKIGIDEIVGLKAEMLKLMKPIEAAILENAYWARGDSLIKSSEYKRRDGFIPHSHNCGGLEISLVIPECESSNFSYLEFGEWDGTHYCDETDLENCECAFGTDGENDAKLRIWFKFEGLENGKLSFYLYLGGGNGDAPYFRTKYESDIFEASFECATVSGLKRAASKHIKALLKIVGES